MIRCSIETQALQFTKYIADKDVHFRAQWNPILIIGNPDRSAPKLAMRSKTVLVLDVDSLNLEIEFDRLAKLARDPDLLALGYSDLDEKRRVAWKGHDTDPVPARPPGS